MVEGGNDKLAINSCLRQLHGNIAELAWGRTGLRPPHILVSSANRFRNEKHEKDGKYKWNFGQ